MPILGKLLGFDNTSAIILSVLSKNHARAMESMQASLEFEQNAKSEEEPHKNAKEYQQKQC